MEHRDPLPCSQEPTTGPHPELDKSTPHSHFVLVTNPLRLIFQLNTCGYSPYVTSSLLRGCVCLLQLLVILARAVILRSESRMTHDHILLSQIRESPNLEGQLLEFISPRNRVARL
jgi:hypothetical protein